jgi:hypothetical protein
MIDAPSFPDSTSDLSPDAPMVRARRGRVTIEVAPVAVQTDDAARVVGISPELLLKIPFAQLPYRRIGSRRWYLVRLLHRLAEQLMAEQIAYGTPGARERFGARVLDAPSPMEHP